MSPITLDEQLEDPELIEALKWITVDVITQLRPGTIVKDDAVPALLRQARRPTFITINVSDFWLHRWRLCAKAYCIVCFKLTSEKIYQLPGLLRKLLRVPEFRCARFAWERLRLSISTVYGTYRSRIIKNIWLPWVESD